MTTVVLEGARTPIGKLLGALSSLEAAELGGIAIKAALERSGVSPEDVDAVVVGHVIQAGAGPNPGRQAAVAAGIPMNVPALTLNKLCLSGLVAIAAGDQMIASGQHEVVVVAGIESMTKAPYLLPGARAGYKYGASSVQDSLDRDALICAFDAISMGASTEKYQAPLNITREEQDAWAERSHRLAAAATASGRFAQEIVPVPVKSRKGVVEVTEDEGIRAETTVDSLAGLRAAFDKQGTITAGNASQLSDGAAALVLCSKEYAERHGLKWLAEVGAHGEVAGPDASLLLQPANAIKDALRRDGSLTIDDMDILEINEAFASVSIASMRDLGVDAAKVNVNGGAISLGHPVGMSGARVFLTAAYELRNRGGGNAAVALCGGGGQGEAMLLKVTV